jgi:hypothetical protein
LQIAGLQDYQSVFEGVVDYVCCAIGLAAKAGAEPSARAQVSAAVESAFPLSGVAYFLTLPAQERLQQVSSLAGYCFIACRNTVTEVDVAVVHACCGNIAAVLELEAVTGEQELHVTS